MSDSSTARTVLVDGLGWTLYEFDRIVPDSEVIAFFRSRDQDGLFDYEVEYDSPEFNPRMKFVRSIYKSTGYKKFLVYIKVRE